MRPCATFVGVLAVTLVASTSLAEDKVRWRLLEPGLEFARVDAPSPRRTAAGPLFVLRVASDRFEVKLLSASLLGLKANPPAHQWATDHGVTVVVNAGMYQKDHASSVGYFRVGKRMNNRHRHRQHKSLLVSGPRKPGLPPVALLDADCDDLWKKAEDYDNVVQGIRMLSCKGNNVWKPGGRAYQQVAVGTDGKGRLLFVYRRAPATSHQFVEQVRSAGLGIRRMMYLEGGAEVSLFIRSAKAEIRLGGMKNLLTELWDNGSEATYLPLPNVIAIKSRSPSGK